MFAVLNTKNIDVELMDLFVLRSVSLNIQGGVFSTDLLLLCHDYMKLISSCFSVANKSGLQQKPRHCSDMANRTV